MRDGRRAEGGEPASAQGSRQSDCSGQRDGMRDRELEEQGAGGPILALKQSNRKGDTARETCLAPHLISPLGFKRKKREKWGNRLEKRNELTPGLRAREGGSAEVSSRLST